MIAEIVARGKASGHEKRARERAERALAEGRTPGKGGRPRTGRCPHCDGVIPVRVGRTS